MSPHAARLPVALRAAVAAAICLVGSEDRYLCIRPNEPCPSGTTLIAAGAFTLAVAVGLAVVGTLLVARNAATTVTQPMAPPESRRRPERSAESLVAPGTPSMFPLAAATF